MGMGTRIICTQPLYENVLVQFSAKKHELSDKYDIKTMWAVVLLEKSLSVSRVIYPHFSLWLAHAGAFNSSFLKLGEKGFF
jgi:hypothetical protein